jgi:hypothetical protein
VFFCSRAETPFPPRLPTHVRVVGCFEDSAGASIIQKYAIVEGHPYKQPNKAKVASAAYIYISEKWIGSNITITTDNKDTGKDKTRQNQTRQAKN